VGSDQAARRAPALERRRPRSSNGRAPSSQVAPAGLSSGIWQLHPLLLLLVAVAPPVPVPLLLELVVEPPVPAPPPELELVEIAHTPAAQVPPGHTVPSAAVGLEQVPDVGSQVPAAWHASLGMQVTGLVPVHAPA